jgi:FAD/FMN-containing dehydrogenase
MRAVGADTEPADGGWSNWSGTVRCRPRRTLHPASEAEIVAAVRAAAAEGLSLRVAGSGHSHPPLVATAGLLLRLDRWCGIEACDSGARHALVRAGSVLHDLGAPLRERGLAMENLGDVDVQALAGALATGTHGTGRSLGNLCTQVLGLRLVGADGGILECSEREQERLFAAARLSLGTLGVTSAVRLRLLPAYRLHEHTWREDVEAVLGRLDALVAEHRHFEFFWLPARDRAECKSLDPTDAEPDPLPERRYERIDHSDLVLPSRREERFVEMEYALPAESGPQAFLELRRMMQQRHPEVLWPVEYRTLAADDAWLSPAFGRDSVTLSVHQGVGLPFRRLFADAEAVFRNHRGRPHWGKWHGCDAETLRGLYPRWEDFHALRRELDPEGRFLNDYLKVLFGEVSSTGAVAR